MDYQTRRILTAAIEEKRELVQMLYDQGRPDDGQLEYQELRHLGQRLREAINGNTGTSNPGTGADPEPE